MSKAIRRTADGVLSPYNAFAATQPGYEVVELEEVIAAQAKGAAEKGEKDAAEGEEAAEGEKEEETSESGSEDAPAAKSHKKKK